MTVSTLLPSGATQYDVTLSDDGRQLRVMFEWPASMYDMSNLFREELADGVQPYHPKFIAHRAELKNVRATKIQRPKSWFIIRLPIVVQTDRASVKRTPRKREDGSKILVIELIGLPNEYVKDATISDNIIEFDI